MVERDATYYMKLRKLRKRMEKVMRKPFSPTVDDARIAILAEIRAVERGDL